MVGNYDTTLLERTLLRWSVIVAASIAITVYVAVATNLLRRAVDFSMWFLTVVANWCARPMAFIIMFVALLISVVAALYYCNRVKQAILS